MGGPIQYGVTDDYFDAVPVSDGIAVRMSDNVALVLSRLVERLIHVLEDGEPSSGKVLRRMFPDAYRKRAEARAFRERHAAALRDSAAARCVHARCAGATQYVINPAEVDDWIATLGLARFLEMSRDETHPGMTGTWINYMQERLVVALNPRLASLTEDPGAGPRTIRRR